MLKWTENHVKMGLRTHCCCCLGLLHVLGERLWWKVSSSGPARVWQEVASEWKVSEVRQMLVQRTVDRTCVSFYGSPHDSSCISNDLRSIKVFDTGLLFVMGNDTPAIPLVSFTLRSKQNNESPYWLNYSCCLATSDPHPSYCSCERLIFCFECGP